MHAIGSLAHFVFQGDSIDFSYERKDVKISWIMRSFRDPPSGKDDREDLEETPTEQERNQPWAPNQYLQHGKGKSKEIHDSEDSGQISTDFGRSDTQVYQLRQNDLPLSLIRH